MFEGEKITAYLAAIAAAKDIRHAVICPGSRSAPLTLAFARQAEITCIPVADERSAGFVALGIAQQTELPVVVICTSGTASLNLAPAIAEAYYQKVPLVILTADRPEEWIDQQDGQAMRQRELYRNFIHRSYHIRGEAWHEDDLWYAQRSLNEAIDIAADQSGPVHVNVAFREPLYQVPAVQPERLRVVRSTGHEVYPVNAEPVQAAAKLAAGYRRILIVAGMLPWDAELEDVLHKLEEYPNVVIVKESVCNLDLDHAITNANECLVNPAAELKPELIISLGGPVVSRRLKQFLRSSGAEHWHITTGNTYMDTFRRLHRLIECHPYTFFFSLAVALRKSATGSDFRHHWKQQSQRMKEQVEQYSLTTPFTDWYAYRYIFSHLPANVQLQLANSTPVRYGQLFAHLQPPETLVYSNRGVSGIDGSISTAVGASLVSEQTVLTIIGDLSFQYDMNAWWNKHLSGNLKVVVINNAGGNIFRLIEGPSSVPELEEFFEMRMQHSFEHLARHFQLDYFRADREELLASAWKHFMESDSGRPAVLEIVTDPVRSAEVFKAFYTSLTNI